MLPFRRGDDDLAYMDVPHGHRNPIASTNPLERVNREIEHRSDVVGIFPNEDAARLEGAPMAETRDEWTVARRYMSLDTPPASRTIPPSGCPRWRPDRNRTSPGIGAHALRPGTRSSGRLFSPSTLVSRKRVAKQGDDMADWVEWDKVESWLKDLGAKNVSTRKDYHEIDDMEIQVHSVSRELGGKTLTAPLNVTTKLVTRPDGVKLRTLQCSREGVADLAKTLVIDPTKVLGPNWENEFRPQAEIYESEMDAEEESEEEEEEPAGTTGAPSTKSTKSTPAVKTPRAIPQAVTKARAAKKRGIPDDNSPVDASRAIGGIGTGRSHRLWALAGCSSAFPCRRLAPGR